MKIYIVGYVLICIVSAVLVSGWFMADVGSIWSKKEWADEHYRRDLGYSVALGSAYAAVWPIGVPIAFCITGFAEHGWTISRKALL